MNFRIRNRESDVSALEAKIDQRFYKLYNHNPVEVAIMKGTQ